MFLAIKTAPKSTLHINYQPTNRTKCLNPQLLLQLHCRHQGAMLQQETNSVYISMEPVKPAPEPFKGVPAASEPAKAVIKSASEVAAAVLNAAAVIGTIVANHVIANQTSVYVKGNETTVNLEGYETTVKPAAAPAQEEQPGHITFYNNKKVESPAAAAAVKAKTTTTTTTQAACNKLSAPAGIHPAMDSEDENVIRKLGFAPLRFIHFGPFSRIYEVVDPRGMQFIAKVESKFEPKKTLGLEARVYNDCKNARGFAMFYRIAEVAGNRVIIMQKLGTDLSRLRRALPEGKLALVDGLKVSLKTFCRVWTLHTQGGWLHRDIKPSNFVVGMPPGDEQIYIVDFGLSRPISTFARPHGHCPVVGTAVYQPIAVHNRVEYRQKDDLESWFYMCVQLITGSLPWIEAPPALMVDFKQFCRTSGRHLLVGRLPLQFDAIFETIINAGDQPNYYRISALLKSALAELGEEKLEEPLAWKRDPGIVLRGLQLRSEN